MRALSGQDLLYIWETGLRQHPLNQALIMLSLALPDLTREELALLSVGQRDGHLLCIREQLFGPRLDGFTKCPACREQLEFSLQVADLRFTPPRQLENSLTADGYAVSFRLPNSRDLLAAAGSANVAGGRSYLIAQCVLKASRGGEDIEVSALPEHVIAALAKKIADSDPQSEVKLKLNCPSCGHDWELLFDITTFLWSEINTAAKRLLHEVHLLARFYSWSEADILTMSPARRQFYLELVQYD